MPLDGSNNGRGNGGGGEPRAVSLVLSFECD